MTTISCIALTNSWLQELVLLHERHDFLHRTLLDAALSERHFARRVNGELERGAVATHGHMGRVLLVALGLKRRARSLQLGQFLLERVTDGVRARGLRQIALIARNQNGRRQIVQLGVREDVVEESKATHADKSATRSTLTNTQQCLTYSAALRSMTKSAESTMNTMQPVTG